MRRRAPVARGGRRSVDGRGRCGRVGRTAAVAARRHAALRLGSPGVVAALHAQRVARRRARRSPVRTAAAEFHGPDWALGQCTMAELADGSLVARMTSEGRDSHRADCGRGSAPVAWSTNPASRSPASAATGTASLSSGRRPTVRPASGRSDRSRTMAATPPRPRTAGATRHPPFPADAPGPRRHLCRRGLLSRRAIGSPGARVVVRARPGGDDRPAGGAAPVGGPVPRRARPDRCRRATTS